MPSCNNPQNGVLATGDSQVKKMLCPDSSTFPKPRAARGLTQSHRMSIHYLESPLYSGGWAGLLAALCHSNSIWPIISSSSVREQTVYGFVYNILCIISGWEVYLNWISLLGMLVSVSLVSLSKHFQGQPSIISKTAGEKKHEGKDATMEIWLSKMN